MPLIAFLANGLWVMVIGLIGPSIPVIINEFGLTYGEAGFIFTLLSAGSLVGTLAGGILSDYPKRGLFFSIFSFCLFLGLLLTAFSNSFSFFLIAVFIFSLFGSPTGAVGQSLMLSIYPDRRKQYLSLQTMFAAGGSFLAPLIVTMVLIAGYTWRAGFFFVSILVAIHFISSLIVKIQPLRTKPEKAASFSGILGDRRIVIIAVLVFLCIGIDLGFSYWLAEYFVRYTGSTVEYSSAAVSVFLAGVICGRFITSIISARFKSWLIVVTGLIISSAALFLFLRIENPGIKLLICFIYGLGVASVFPMLISMGTSCHPDSPGVVTGVLFASMSLGGMVFPFLIGLVGQNLGIETAYGTLFVLIVLILAGTLIAGKSIRHSGS